MDARRRPYSQGSGRGLAARRRKIASWNSLERRALRPSSVPDRTASSQNASAADLICSRASAVSPCRKRSRSAQVARGDTGTTSVITKSRRESPSTRPASQSSPTVAIAAPTRTAPPRRLRLLLYHRFSRWQTRRASGSGMLPISGGAYHPRNTSSSLVEAAAAASMTSGSGRFPATKLFQGISRTSQSNSSDTAAASLRRLLSALSSQAASARAATTASAATQGLNSANANPATAPRTGATAATATCAICSRSASS
jgi:hypothetical protein